MANVNSNKNQGRTGGPGVASTGAKSQTKQPDSQKGSGANATGAKDYVEKDQAQGANPDSGKQLTDPVQTN